MAKDRTQLSFREAEGKRLHPDFLQWGELDQRLRALLFEAWHLELQACAENTVMAGNKRISGKFGGLLYDEHVERSHKFSDEFPHGAFKFSQYVSGWKTFFAGEDYVEIFDLLTFALRHKNCPKTLTHNVRVALDKPYSPYRLHPTHPTIVPVTSDVHAKTLLGDLERVSKSRFSGAIVHMQAALGEFSSGKFRDSIRESIHAIESAVRDFTGKPSAVLSGALTKLRSAGELHPALSMAFEKLYAYTSDESGIRHALVIEDNESVKSEEALFLFHLAALLFHILPKKIQNPPELELIDINPSEIISRDPSPPAAGRRIPSRRASSSEYACDRDGKSGRATSAASARRHAILIQGHAALTLAQQHTPAPASGRAI